ncbi:MotA/TolQ/ExbB proton channel family protein [Rhizosaccharibacter radicis]|uniref:Biopolymer transport protein ExbB n=1 Tax=Rhizosaccharibacter radicis TaxID=2782605 RepID=A0ABT1VZZ4_9PROT|nr:MotA/TolQ/ExbB proton channel family protein [Acetobacteraceae bacterium KSS12]
MTRTHRLPVLAAPALAMALGLAAPGAVTQALAQDAQQQAAPAPAAPATPPPATPAAGAPATPDASAPAPAAGAPAAPDASAPATSPTAPGAPGSPAPAGATASGAPAGDAGAAAVPAAAPATAQVSNPYGLDALWKGGDFISRGVLIILVIMSLGTWYIMITKFFEQARLFSASRSAQKDFWTKPSVTEGATSLKDSSPFRYIADTGIAATNHHEGTLTESIDLHEWVTMSIQRAVEAIQSRLQGGLAFLATVGSTAPFVGLFGTVWGIYHALTAIGIAGQASIDKVAGPVGEALIMTAIGLATAVPAVLGYNWLVRRNKGAMERVRNFSSDLHSVLLGGVRVGTQSAGAPTPAGVTRVA